MRAFGLLMLTILLLPSPAPAADGRLRGLSYPVAAIDSGPGNLLAGDVVVYSAPRRVFGWPVTGGRARPLARVPKGIGPADNELIFGTGYRRIAAAQPGRVALIRDGGPDFFPNFEPRYGKQLVVGPPQGPFVDPTGCGEATGGPVSLDGDRIAYRAAPMRHGCADAAVTEHAVVIRDLADGNRLEAVIPLPAGIRRLTRIELAGPFVAFSGRPGEFEDDARERVAVVDTRNGAEVLRLPNAQRLWALDVDGTLAAAEQPGLRCNRTEIRIHAPGDPVGEPVAGQPCDGLFDLDAGVLRFGERRGHRLETVDVNVATGDRRLLATTAGLPLDADAEHLVVDDRTCGSTDLRVVALAEAPVEPAETDRCLKSLRVPRTVRAGKPIRFRATCPRGCRLEVRGRVPGDAEPLFSDSFDPARSTTLEVAPTFSPLERGQTVRLRVVSSEPTVGRRRHVFRVRVW